MTGQGASESEATDAVRRRPRQRLSRSSDGARHGGGWLSELDLRAEAAVHVLLPLVVLASVHLIGTVHLPAVLGVGALCLWLGVAAVRSSTPADARLAAVLAAFGIYSGLQALPLPFGLVEVVAPANAEIWARALRSFNEGPPPLVSISLDPGGSLVEAIKWLSYAAVAFGASGYARRRGFRSVALIVFVSAVSVALVTLLHGLLGATRVFGLYEPTTHHGRWGLGPLLNPNNLAGYMNLGAFCGVGSVVTLREPSRRGLAALGVVLCVAVGLLTGSRGGVLAVALCSVLLLVVFAVRARDARFGLAVSRVPWVVGTLALGGGFALLGLTPEIQAELLEFGTGKIGLALASLPLISVHWGWGVGRGAFESTFSQYDSDGTNLVFSSPENFLLQWSAEWGVWVTALGVVGGVWALLPALRAARGQVAVACALVGVVAVLLQNLVDLALELPAMLVALVALLSAAGHSSRRHRWLGPTRLPFQLVAPTCMLVALAVGVLIRPKSVRAARELVHVSLSTTDLAQPVSQERFFALLREQMQRFPAEPYFPYVGGLVTRQLQKQSALPWFARALEQQPFSGRTHLAVAGELWRMGAQDQALLELRYALEQTPALSRDVAQQLRRWKISLASVHDVLPSGEAGVASLVEVARAFDGESFSAERTALLREALARRPGDFEANLAMSEDYLKRLRDGTDGPCSAQGSAECLRLARDHAERAERARPMTGRPLALTAALLMQEGRQAEAVSLLSRECPRSEGRAHCYRRLIEFAASAGDRAALNAAVTPFLGDHCWDDAQCAEACAFIAAIYEGLGDLHTAVTYAERAAQRVPKVATWLEVARLADRTGALQSATLAVKKAEMLAQGDADAKQRIERVKAALSSQTP